MPHNDPTTPAEPKPASIALRLENIPVELKKLDRWITWSYVKSKQGKWTKRPIDPVSGRATDATVISNGYDFVTAVKALKAHRNTMDGIGFLLGGGYAGIDVDDCLDPETGEMTEFGQKVSRDYTSTYAEVSPSGTGFKIVVQIGDDSNLAMIGKSTKDIEIYGSNRYFTVTGALLAGHTKTIATLPDLFAATAATVGGLRNTRLPAPGPEGIAPLALDNKSKVGFDYAAARGFIDHLPFLWFENYQHWLKLGMALHHEYDGHPDALRLWDEVSRRSTSNYEPGACEIKWKTFGRVGGEIFTIRSVVYVAKQSGWQPPRNINDELEVNPFDEVDLLEVDETEPDLMIPKDWWQQHSISKLLRTPAPEFRWIWKGVLRVGKVMLLAGSGGSSKSYLMLASALNYALGLDFGPMVPGDIEGRVMIMYGEEDKDDVHVRAQTLRHEFMLTEEQIYALEDRLAVLPLRESSVPFMRLENDQAVPTQFLKRLEERITQYKVKLLIVDPLSMFHELEENSNRHMQQLVHEIDTLAYKTDCAIILVHHFGKSVQKATEISEANVRGASAMVAHVRSVFVLHRMRENEATEWGVPAEDHAKWVMWANVKNNYGASGGRFWFNINENNGAITPAHSQLNHLSPQDLRAQVQAVREQDAEREFNEAEGRRAAQQAAREVEEVGRMYTLLRHAEETGTLLTIKNAIEFFEQLGHDVANNAVRATLKRIKDEFLVDTDGMISTQGHQWLEAHELLG